MHRNKSDIKSRLIQINRMSVELSVTSSVLANLAAQLNNLRAEGERNGWHLRRSKGLLKSAKKRRASLASTAVNQSNLEFEPSSYCAPAPRRRMRGAA